MSHGADAVIDLLTAAQRAPVSDVYEADVAIFKSSQDGADGGGGAGGGGADELPRVLSDSENYLAYTLKNGCALRFLDRSNNRRCLLKAHSHPIHAVRFVKYHSNVGASAAEGEFFVWVVTDGAQGKGDAEAAGGGGGGSGNVQGGGKLNVSIYFALRDAVTVYSFAFFINPSVGGPDVLLLHDRKASILESSRLIRQYANATMDATVANDTRDLRQLSRPADRHSLCTCRAGDWFAFTMEPTLVVACTLRNRSTPAWAPCAGEVVRSLELLDVFAPDAPALLLAGTDARVYQWALTGDAEPSLLRVFGFATAAAAATTTTMPSGSVPRIVAVLGSRNTIAIFNDAAQAVLIDCAASGDGFAATLFAMDAAVSPPGVCFNRTQSYGFVLASNSKCIKMYQFMLDGGSSSSNNNAATATVAQGDGRDDSHAAAPSSSSSPPSPPHEAALATATTTTTAAAPATTATSSLSRHASPQVQPLPLGQQHSDAVKHASPSSPLTIDPAVLSVSSNTIAATPVTANVQEQLQQQRAAGVASSSPLVSPTQQTRGSPTATRNNNNNNNNSGGGGVSVLGGLLQQLERGNLKPPASAAAAAAPPKVNDGKATEATATMAAATASSDAAANKTAAATVHHNTATLPPPPQQQQQPPAATATTQQQLPPPPPPPPPSSSTMVGGSVMGRVALHNVALPQPGDGLLAAATYQSDASVRKELEGLQTVIHNIAEIAELTPSQVTRDHEQLVSLALEAQMTELQSYCAAVTAEATAAATAAAANRNNNSSSSNKAGNNTSPASREDDEAFNSFAIVKLIAPLSKEIASGVTRGLRDTLRTELDSALRAALGGSVRDTQKALIKRRLDEALRDTSAFYTREVTTRMREFVERELVVGVGRFATLLQRAQEDNHRLRAALQRMTAMNDVCRDVEALRSEVQALRDALASGAYVCVGDGGAAGAASGGAAGGGGANPSSFTQPGRPTPETMLSTARALLADGKTHEALFYITEVRQPALTLQLLREVDGDAYTRMVADEAVSDEVWMRVLSQLSGKGVAEATKEDAQFAAELMFDVLAEHDTLTTARTAQAQQTMSDVRHFVARLRRAASSNNSNSSSGNNSAAGGGSGSAADDADMLRILRGLEKTLL